METVRQCSGKLYDNAQGEMSIIVIQLNPNKLGCGIAVNPISISDTRKSSKIIRPLLFFLSS